MMMMKMMTALMSLGHMVINTNAQTLGQQVDNHNCILDGGYQWCESQNKCVRPWVTPCHQYPIDPLPVMIDPIELPRPTDPMLPVVSRPVVSRPVVSRPTIPYNCASWYDGCNRCMIQEGKIGACTRMMCFTKSKSACLSYKRLTEGDTCYRFCEDGSQVAVDLKDKCPSGTTCTPSNSIGFDSCNDATWKCLNSH